ncbi:glycolipid transfer protein [Aureococcus anophagefferens]|nr:glycolipid transfer protein [Aureococcus anophagefferens]
MTTYIEKTKTLKTSLSTVSLEGEAKVVVARVEQSKTFLAKYQACGVAVALALAVAAASHARFDLPGGAPGPAPAPATTGAGESPEALLRAGFSETAGFFAQSWWLPGAAVVMPTPQRRRRRRPRRSAASGGAAAPRTPSRSPRSSRTLLRKARGRGAKMPVHGAQFMDAIAALMPAFQVFGSAIHAAAARDVLGNVEKLRANGAPGIPVHRGVLDDVARRNEGHPDSTTQAFVWLKRILRFTAAFFDNLVKRPDLELNACLVKAYEVHLGPHHNVIMRQIAVVLMQIIPDRASMLACFDVDDMAALEPVLNRWIDGALPLIAKIDQFYEMNGLKR